MKRMLFVIGLGYAAFIGGIGLLWSASSPEGIQFLENDLIAIGIFGLGCGALLALVGAAFEDMLG